MSTPSGPSTAESTISVGVYDESELVVFGVRGMFAHHGGRAWVRPLADGRTTTGIDVLLCDPLDRDVDLETYLDRVEALTAAPIIAFTWAVQPRSASRALDAGARGVVPKSASARELVAAVEAVHRGELVAPKAGTVDGRLSAREADVLHLVCRGLSNDEIASALLVSVNSIKTHLGQIYRKIGVARRAQAVAWGLTRGY